MTVDPRWRRIKRQQATELGRYLRALRLEGNYSLRELAARSGISYSHLNMLEKGQRHASPRTISRLAPTLRVPTDDLLRMAGYLPPGRALPRQAPGQELLVLARRMYKLVRHIDHSLMALDGRVAKLEIYLRQTSP